MYRRQVRRRRAVLVLLVVACLVMISTHFSEGRDGPLHTAQSGVGAVLGPLQEGASRALKPVRDLVNWFDETFDARGENEDLRAEVQDLREQLNASEQALEEGRERGKIAKIAEVDPLAGFEPVDARVIGRSASTWSQTLQIDKGRSSGVETDDSVITGDGLIGRVSSTSKGSSRIALLTDEETSVTGEVVGKNGPLGVVGAKVGDPEELVFELIQGDKEVDSGSELVTAGFTSGDGELASRFPAGIPIGEAQESNAGEQERRQQISVKPFADMSNIEFVSVLTGGSSE